MHLSFQNGGVLLDCGEGSLGQLYRLHGLSFLDEVRRLRLIFISHHHADHQLGLLSVLQAYNRARTADSPVLVILAPAPFRSFVLEAAALLPDANPFVFVDCESAAPHSGSVVDARLAECLADLRLSSLLAVPVVHCASAFGLVLEGAGPLDSKHKIVYSGDTRPTEALSVHGRGASLLIHESTFEDALQQEAVDKHHSTVGEAMHIAGDMKAAFVILTHFSQRYPKFPGFAAYPRFEGKAVALAFDLMSVTNRSIERVPGLLQQIEAAIGIEDYA